MDFLREIERRFTTIYSNLQHQKDLSPANKYRLEGFIEAAIAADKITATQLAAIQSQAYESVFGEAFNAGQGVGVIAPKMMRAPVKPSTKD